MSLSYFEFPHPPKAPTIRFAEPGIAVKSNEPLIFSDDLFDIDDMPELDQEDLDFLLQMSDTVTSAPRPPPRHPDRAKSRSSTRSSLIASRTRRALSVSSAKSDLFPSFTLDDLLLSSPVPSLSHLDYSSCGESICSEEVVTPPATTLGWTTEEKDFMMFTGNMTQRSRATSKCPSRTPSGSYSIRDMHLYRETEAPPLPVHTIAELERYASPTPSPLRVPSRPSTSTPHSRSSSTPLVTMQSVSSNRDPEFRVDAIIVRSQAQMSAPRHLRRRPAIPMDRSLRQLRVEQSEACLKAVYERQCDAYLDGTIALGAFGL